MTHIAEASVALYLHDIANKPPLKREQELALFARAEDGDVTAYHAVIESHLKMVVFIARHHQGQLSLADRIEEGNLGMMHALRKFNPSYGCRFATYAVWWVRAYIERAISNHACIVRIPVYVRQEINVVRRTESLLTIAYSREPTSLEIAKQMETNVSHVQSLLYLAQPQLQSNDLALSGDIGIEDNHAESLSPETQLEQKQKTATIAHWLASLKPRERQVICARFGLQGVDEKTLEAIGAEMHCSKERVRQIQVAALQHLRNYITAKYQKGTLYDCIPFT